MKKMALVVLYCFLSITYMEKVGAIFDKTPDSEIYSQLRKMGWQCYNWPMVDNVEFPSPGVPIGTTRTCFQNFLSYKISVSSADTILNSCVSVGGIRPMTAVTKILQGYMSDMKVLKGGYYACGARAELDAFWRVMEEQTLIPHEIKEHMISHRYEGK